MKNIYSDRPFIALKHSSQKHLKEENIALAYTFQIIDCHGGKSEKEVTHNQRCTAESLFACCLVAFFLTFSLVSAQLGFLY